MGLVDQDACESSSPELSGGYQLLNTYATNFRYKTLVAYPNGTRRTGQTDAQGEWRLDLYRTDHRLTFLAAAPGYLPLADTVPPKPGPTVTYRLKDSTDGREGLLFTAGTGSIPGIEGRLNPINDDGSLYLYTDNIAINGSVLHPAPLKIGEDLHLMDVYGVETTIRFLVLTSQFSLIEYTKPQAYGEH